MKFILGKKSVRVVHAVLFILQKWFNGILINFLSRKKNRKNLTDSYDLSEHLMNDLGFDRHGNPLHWSSSHKPPIVFHEANQLRTVAKERDNIDKWGRTPANPAKQLTS